MTTPDFHLLALDLCKQRGVLDVALAEKAIELGYTLCAQEMAVELEKVRLELCAARHKANSPQ